MSASGTIILVARASCGDNRTPSWRCTIRLDNPRALPDTGPDRGPHDWAVDLPRTSDKAPFSEGDRITVSTHGKRNVLVTLKSGPSLTFRSYAPGVYDDAQIN